MLTELERVAAMSPEEKTAFRKELQRSSNLADPQIQELFRASYVPTPSVPKPKVKQLEPEPRGAKGWIDNLPFGPPPGVALCDRMMDAQDRRDRAALIEAEAVARKVDEEIKRRGR
jgi:hypothetical protein